MKIHTLIGSLAMASILGYGIYGIGNSLASDRYEYKRGGEYRERYDDDDHYRRAPQLENSLYKEECGSCHMAYPPMLLPSESWQKMMAGLEDHFGENAELDPKQARDIEIYLVQNTRSIGYRKLLPNPESDIPTSITELPYFKREHDEIPSRLIEENDNVGSLSQCNACHRHAEKGYFDEDSIVIPGFGRWDD